MCVHKHMCMRARVCVCVCVYRQVFSKFFSEFIFQIHFPIVYSSETFLPKRFVKSSPEEEKQLIKSLIQSKHVRKHVRMRMRRHTRAHMRMCECAHAQVLVLFCRSDLSNPVLKSRKERDMSTNCVGFFSHLFSIPNISNYAEL